MKRCETRQQRRADRLSDDTDRSHHELARESDRRDRSGRNRGAHPLFVPLVDGRQTQSEHQRQREPKVLPEVVIEDAYANATDGAGQFTQGHGRNRPLANDGSG